MYAIAWSVAVNEKEIFQMPAKNGSLRHKIWGYEMIYVVAMACLQAC